MKNRILFLSLVIASLLMSSCSKDEGLVGKWTADGKPTVIVDAGAMSGMLSQFLEQALTSEEGNITEFTFNADGTGIATIDGDAMPFNYTSTSKAVTFTFADDDVEDMPFNKLTANYTISKKRLTIKFDFTEAIKIAVAAEHPEVLPYISSLKSVVLEASYKKVK